MDPVSVLYYGAICGLLALFSPELGRAAARLACGFAVGLVAAALLPVLKGVLAG